MNNAFIMGNEKLEVKLITKIYEIQEKELEGFREVISTLDIDIYHDIEWLRLNQDLKEGDVNCILLQNENDIAFFPLIKRRIQNTCYFDLITPYGYGGVAFNRQASPSFKNSILLQLKNYILDKNYVSLFLRLHPLINKDLNNNPRVFNNGSTVVVDLNVIYEDLFQRYASGHKSDLRKSNKNEMIEIVDDKEFVYINDFIKLYYETMTFLNASDFYFFNEKYFTDMKILLENNLKLVVVKCKGEVIGGSLFLLRSNIINYHLSATSLDGRKFQPSKLILDYIIRFGIDKKYQFLHLGGGIGGKKDQLYKFKKGFGGRDLDFCTVRMIGNSDIYKNLCIKKGYSDGDIKNTQEFFPLYRK